MRRLLPIVFVAACGGHRHGPNRSDDPSRLYVEIAAEGSHRGALRDGAAAALSKISFVVPTNHNGDVELQVEVAQLDTAGNQTICGVKILVLRLPQHDLLGIADGNARAGGTSRSSADACVAGVTSTLVRGKVRGLLKRRLADKR